MRLGKLTAISLVFLNAFSGCVTTPGRPVDTWTGKDKVIHFSASAVMSAGSYGVFSLPFEKPWQRAVAASGLTLGIGTLKEIADATNGGIFSYHDFAYNIFGTILGLGISLGIDYAIRF